MSSTMGFGGDSKMGAGAGAGGEVSSTFNEVSSIFAVSSTFAVLFTSGLSKNEGKSFVSFNGT